MEKNITKILNDLYAIEPSLKAKEAMLLPLIERMVLSKPDIRIDENFVAELRSNLVRQAMLTKPVKSPFAWLTRPYAFGALGALVALIVIIPLVSNNNNGSITFGSRIEDLQSQAFGPVVTSAAYGTDGPGAGFGGGGNQAKDVSAASEVARSSESSAGFGVSSVEPAVLGSDAAVSSRIMPVPPEMSYKLVFEYEGDGSFETKDSLPVYKRKISGKPSGDLAAVIAKLDLDLADLRKFRNLKIGNVSLQEDREFGYHIDLNLKENQLMIYKNWEKWPQANYKCMAIGCESGIAPVSPSDVPKDSELFALADEFLRQYGIDDSFYGEKFISDQWRRFPMALAETGVTGENSTMMYVPDEVMVVYQLVLDDLPVYEEAGQPAGLNVAIDVRSKRVSGANTIVPHNYQRSSYPAITDPGEIVSEALKGGRFGYYGGYGDNPKIRTIKLGTPKLVLMRAWLPESEGSLGGEAYVPAYLFPVTSRPEGVPYVADNIVVPAIKGFFPENPQIYPMDATVRPI